MSTGTKVEREEVLFEHVDGTPHLTVGSDGSLNHYAGPCPLTRAIETLRQARGAAAGKAAGDGPVQVATEDYRRGWDATFGRAPRTRSPASARARALSAWAST